MTYIQIESATTRTCRTILNDLEMKSAKIKLVYHKFNKLPGPALK